MPNDTAGLNAYRSAQNQAQALTADPHRLIQLLFANLMMSLQKAKGFLERKQMNEKGKSITHAIEILLALDEAIDEEKGGELAGNLRSLYNYCIRQLIAANQECSMEKLEEVQRLMLEIKVAWDSIEGKTGDSDAAAAQ